MFLTQVNAFLCKKYVYTEKATSFEIAFSVCILRGIRVSSFYVKNLTALYVIMISLQCDGIMITR